MTANPTTALAKRASTIDYLLLLALATLWGASYNFIRVGVQTIPPITLIAARTLLAGVLLLLVMKARGIAMPLDRATWGRFLFQSCLNSVFPWTLLAWAEQTVDAGLATILNSAAPIFTFLFTWGLTRHEEPTARKLAGVAAGAAGVTLIVGAEALGGLGRELAAQLAIVVATLCYAGAAVFGRHFKELNPIVPAAGSLICGGVVLAPLSLAVDHPWTLHPSENSLISLMGLSVFSTALAFILYFRLITTLGSVGTTAQAYLRVPVGVALGVIFLGETLPSTGWFGFACVVIGVAAMTIPARAPK